MAARARRPRIVAAALLLLAAAGALALGWRAARSVTARPAPVIVNIPADDPAAEFAQEVKTFISTPSHPEGLAFLGDPRDKVFHRPGCERVPYITDPQRLATRAGAEAGGWQPCDLCKP